MKAIFRKFDANLSKYIIDSNVTLPPLEKYSILIEIKACGLSEISNEILFMCTKAPSSVHSVGCDVAGIVRQVGTDVNTVKEGDVVVGIVPLDYNVSGCAEYVILNMYDIVKVPENVSFVDAAGCIGDALKAYTALHYLGHMSSGDTILVMDGASGFGSTTIQLAQTWGGKVIATASTDDEILYLKGLEPKLAAVIDLRKDGSSILNCLNETGGLGVDIIIDNGVSMFKNSEDIDNLCIKNCRRLPSKHEIISCLSVGGKWITQQHDLQLDPPNSKLLFMKGACVGFLFEHSWSLSSAQQGRYQHILTDIVEKIAEKTIRPNIHHSVTFESVPETLRHLEDVVVGKVVMTM